MALFRLQNHSTHTNDMLYFFGFHYENFAYKVEDYLMDIYYPRLIKSFVWGELINKGKFKLINTIFYAKT